MYITCKAIFWVQRDCCKYKSQVCNNLSDIMWVPTTNRTRYVAPMLCVENLYVKVNTYVAWKKKKSCCFSATILYYGHLSVFFVADKCHIYHIWGR